MAILTVNQTIDNIDSFINNIKKLSKSYYMFVGKPDPWTDDNIVPVANASVEQAELSLYRDLIYGKLIANTDVSYMIRRKEWTNNTIYAQYSKNDPDLIDKDFFVLTDLGEVYKCIYNNANTVSTIKPSLNTPYGTFKTSDGYIWKYMYTVGINANNKFSTSSYVPVTVNANVEAAAVAGTIDYINITSPGTNYQIYNEGFLKNTLAGGYQVVLPNTASQINGLYVGSSIYLKAGAGAGQIRSVTEYSGLTKLLSVNPPFTVYVNLNLANVQGNIDVGNRVTQNSTYVSYLYSTGSFDIGNNVIQTDTGATGTIAVANSSNFILTKNNSTSDFSLNYPFYNSAVAGTTKTGNVTIIAGNNFVIANTGTDFVSNYASGNFIRVGNTTSNVQIRRIISVNSTVIICDANTPFSQTYISNVHSIITAAAVPVSVSSYTAYGTVTYTNLTGININITNTSPVGSKFTAGEQVIQIDEYNVNQGANAIVSFANDSVVQLTSVSGTITANLFVLGKSSNVKAQISSVTSYPNITVEQPIGSFNMAQPIFAANSSGNTTGNAQVIFTSITPNQLTEYVISPKVTITGDGNGALAYAYVNTDDSINPSRSISEIRMINIGQNYTIANVTITANNLYGSGAIVDAVISPENGHGSNTYMELGAKYAGISVTFANGDNESYKFPVTGNYRRIGILEDPTINDAIFTLDSFDRVRLYLGSNNGTSFINNEIIYQANTGKAGVMVFANSSYLELKNVANTNTGLPFYTFGNTTSQSVNTSVLGLTSGATANIVTTAANGMVNSSVAYFSLLSNVQSVSEITSGAYATIISISNNTTVRLSNLLGHFNANDTLYDSQTNTYANVVSIYVSNGSIDATTNFGHSFNQTCRIPLTANSGIFTPFEQVTQAYSNGTGTVLTYNKDVDLVLTVPTGTFINGDKLTGNTTGACAIVLWANNSYVRCTNLNGTFANNEIVKNQLLVQAQITNVYPALVLYNVYNIFSTGNNTITGATSGATGVNTLTNTILYPELIRGSGTTSYLENIVPFTRSNTSTEKINIVIKF